MRLQQEFAGLVFLSFFALIAASIECRLTVALPVLLSASEGNTLSITF